ncbi:MAG: tRNA 2-thiouridine(34) synthase MnmA [Patescibacteria group bacterium]
MLNKRKKVFVAMSGGVDSSVAAALLKKQGHNVVGVFMKPWEPSNIQINCLWKEERESALLVAAKLDIPLLTWDFSKEYQKQVAEYMIREYGKGRTPNPDVMCNKFIKFGLFLDKALEFGADYIATGHYVRVKKKQKGVARLGVRRDRTPYFFSLYTAKDENKDQSYFLYTLTQEQLKHCLFPIGDYTKSEVRQLARKFGLPNWDKPDSQGICFVGELELRDYLKTVIKPREGLVLRKSDGKILGKHQGVWYYTIGQRHGFDLAVGKPHYIVAKDIEKNILYVDEEFQNKKQEIKMKDFNWINKGELPLNCKVKTRYRQKDLDCTIVKNGSAEVLIKIKQEKLAIAPGQAAVFYRGKEVLGGGIIS